MSHQGFTHPQGGGPSKLDAPWPQQPSSKMVCYPIICWVNVPSYLMVCSPSIIMQGTFRLAMCPVNWCPTLLNMCAKVVTCSNGSLQHMCSAPQPTSMKYDPQPQHPQVKYLTFEVRVAWSHALRAKCLRSNDQRSSSYVGTSHNQAIDSHIVCSQWVSHHATKDNLLGKCDFLTLCPRSSNHSN